MFEALQDVTLVILIILGIISLALSFYPSSRETFEAEIKQSKFIIKTNKK